MQLLLVMDPSESGRLADWLGKSDFEVHETSRIRPAMSFLKQHPEVDVIITDLDFPEDNGEEFLRHLQRHHRLKRIPVIAYTGTIERDRVIRTAALGVHDFLVRPCREEVLLKKVNHVLERKTGSVLVVDDEPIIRDLLAHILQREGFEVAVAANGVEAMDLMAQQKVSLVITDLMMPEMDGMELLVQVKDKFPGVRVILITGKRSEKAREDAIAAGADGYITKPFKNIEIARKLEGLF